MVVDVFTANVLEQADLVNSGLLLLLEGEESSSLRSYSREGGNRPEFSECHRKFFRLTFFLDPPPVCVLMAGPCWQLVLDVQKARLGFLCIPQNAFWNSRFCSPGS